MPAVPHFETANMKFNIQGNPDYGELVVELDPQEKILSEGGAMSRMAADLSLSDNGVIRKETPLFSRLTRSAI